MLEFQTFYFAKKSRRRSIATHYSISHKIYTEDQFLQIQFKHINGDKYSVYGCQSKKLCGGEGGRKRTTCIYGCVFEGTHEFTPGIRGWQEIKFQGGHIVIKPLIFGQRNDQWAKLSA